ncbi:Crp/Fnr family transcriptional regulator [Elizabethkingia meningoseptica]|uniref:Crp/Fnr family transcriptional regulator n=1 Tax=Elizabethkingia meningoseptica TaxID=238 RepID=UPI002DD6721D|nr:Crp/Fnr family transcriptional regulator [Elizabethkingia meningoseptica]MEC4712990.1 Crp/Fnr family transcriptional regulator [Elizabethkingia meningoseptica]
MFETLFKYLNKQISSPFSEQELELVKNAFTPMKIRKRQYFLNKGDICKYFAFIVKGAMRQYIVDDKGVEHIVHLGIENWWIGDRESWVMLSPSNYYIDAWEDSELLLITRADSLRLLHELPAFGEFVRSLYERNSIATQKRITSSISNTAKKRYSYFINCFPDFLERFPQHIIASYLGITKETLSRIRKQGFQK